MPTKLIIVVSAGHMRLLLLLLLGVTVVASNKNLGASSGGNQQVMARKFLRKRVTRMCPTGEVKAFEECRCSGLSRVNICLIGEVCSIGACVRLQDPNIYMV